MAVRRGRLERLRGDLATGAGAVLDHHRCAQLVLEFLGQRAGDRVGAGAGRKADQELDRRALLRLREAREARHRGQKPECEDPARRGSGNPT